MIRMLLAFPMATAAAPSRQSHWPARHHALQDAPDENVLPLPFHHFDALSCKEPTHVHGTVWMLAWKTLTGWMSWETERMTLAISCRLPQKQHQDNDLAIRCL